MKIIFDGSNLNPGVRPEVDVIGYPVSGSGVIGSGVVLYHGSTASGVDIVEYQVSGYDGYEVVLKDYGLSTMDTGLITQPSTVMWTLLVDDLENAPLRPEE